MNATDVAGSATKSQVNASAAEIAKIINEQNFPALSRNIRQRDIVPEAELANWQIIIVGCGAIGHQIARQLAALGVVDAILVDYDIVGIENMSAQGFCEDEIAKPKVDIVADEMSRMFPNISLRCLKEKFSATKVKKFIDPDKKVVIFSCVDSMAARKEIHESMAGKADMFIDSRMGAQSGSVICCSASNWGEYTKTLFPDSEGYEGPCTAKSTCYCANIISGFAVSRFVKRLCMRHVEPKLCVNIPFGDVYVEEVYS